MKIALISDIHSNLEALQAALRLIDSEGADIIYCTGDIVGYGPQPNECLELILARADEIVGGNHDMAAAGRITTEHFTTYARTAISWTRQELNEANREALASLPLKRDLDGITLVHSNPSQPETWEYILSVEQAEGEFAAAEFIFCFFGHSHIPVGYERSADGSVHTVEIQKLAFNPGSRYLINLGSVGQPRDCLPQACVGILDQEHSTFFLKRTSYDIEAVQQKMRRSGLPEYLINRLEKGR